MPKQLITLIGLIISLGVVALGVFLVALPLYFQSLSTDQQTASVAQTNAIYQAQVDGLRAEAERQDEIDASVAALRAQIPGLPQLDGVFEVVGRAAEATGVTIQEITAGEMVAFTARTGDESVIGVARPATGGGDNPTEDGTTDTGTTDSGTTDTGTTDTGTTDSGTGTGGSTAAPSTGRQQIDFSIRVAAADMNQATAFLDALRAGPRLLNSINAITGTEPSGNVTLRISALTYVDMEG